MKKSKFTEEQIAYALRQVEGGTPPADVCRQLGVSEATFYIWKKKYAHPGVRVPERPSVHVDRGCAGQDRSVAHRLQCAPATQLARTPDTERVRRPTSGRTDRERGGIL